MKDISSETEGDTDPVPSPSAGRKRMRSTTATRKIYTESDATSSEDQEDVFIPKSKRVKSEPVEDESLAGVKSDDEEDMAFV